LSNSISNGSIVNCNIRLWNSVDIIEPIKLWEIGKQIGITCGGDEEKVIRELENMEERDYEGKKKCEEGNKTGCL